VVAIHGAHVHCQLPATSIASSTVSASAFEDDAWSSAHAYHAPQSSRQHLGSYISPDRAWDANPEHEPVLRESLSSVDLSDNVYLRTRVDIAKRQREDKRWKGWQQMLL